MQLHAELEKQVIFVKVSGVYDIMKSGQDAVNIVFIQNKGRRHKSLKVFVVIKLKSNMCFRPTVTPLRYYPYLKVPKCSEV
ncbi:hypothetical protein FQR65_LT04756 [Abscondita terminalis]|nr:hypothetical protein FQR65_LT04756 [Abscondita terminalis]